MLAGLLANLPRGGGGRVTGDAAHFFKRKKRYLKALREELDERVSPAEPTLADITASIDALEQPKAKPTKISAEVTKMLSEGHADTASALDRIADKLARWDQEDAILVLMLA
jgi:hypothetical protein